MMIIAVKLGQQISDSKILKSLKAVDFMPRKLLLVEDEQLQEQLLLQFCRKDLKAGKYEIIYAATGEEALQRIEADRDHEIELIIADLKMPAARIDGWELIKVLNREHIDIKTIIVTAVGSENDFTEEERKNILFFLDKMTSLETLKFLLEFALNIPDKFDINSQKV
ncbi:MAG: response regulator, partial [Microcystaceae cyanobacterium]